MKKLLRKAFSKRQTPETGGRITNETVAEHRERVLAGGRKFKYPLQYTKHRVLFLSILIVIVTTIGFLGFCAWQLYGIQNTGRFMYSFTQFVPVPVASVNGEWVKYSDYLLELRSAIHYLTTKEATNFNSDDGKRLLDFQKRQALDKAIGNALVVQLANENNISVSQQEVDEFVQKQITAEQLGVDEMSYRQVIRQYYDWSFDEYKDAVRKQLLRKKVLAQLDTGARKEMQSILATISKPDDFSAAAKKHSEDVATKARGGDVGFVSMDTDDPSNLILVAGQLEPNQISDIIEGVDGLYAVQLLGRRDNGDIRFAKIYVSYKLLDERLAQLREEGKVQEYIHIEALAQPVNQ